MTPTTPQPDYDPDDRITITALGQAVLTNHPTIRHLNHPTANNPTPKDTTTHA